MTVKMQFKSLLFLAACCSFVMLSCGDHSSNRAAARLHDEFRGTKLQDIYRQSSPRLRARITEAEFVSKLTVLQLRIGEIQEISKFNVPGPRMVDDAKLDFTSYHIKGFRNEYLETIMGDWQTGEPRLLNYSARLNPDKCKWNPSEEINPEDYSPVRITDCSGSNIPTSD